MLSQTYKYNAISKNRFQCCFSPGIWGETDKGLMQLSCPKFLL